MAEYSYIIINQDMINKAKSLVNHVEVNRTKASQIDTLTGILGEFAFAQYLYKDWTQNSVGKNKGKTDFINLEIKTSAYPFRESLNLLVREDYAKKRKPPFYVQIIIDVKQRDADSIINGDKAYIAGWATAKDVDNAPKKDFGSKLSNQGGYKCHYIPIWKLNKMDNFKTEYFKNSYNLDK